jgi:ArsR family transcriptional regulator
MQQRGVDKSRKVVQYSSVATSASLDLDRAVALFHALSDPIRLSIMEILRSGERCVCDLQDDLNTAQSKLSFHLKVLREAGLVSDRREGRWSYYSIVPEGLAEVHDLAVGMKPKKGALPVLRSGSCCS